MPAQDVRVTIRVNREVKTRAETLFRYMGLNMSNAVNIFLRRTIDQKGIPFPVEVMKQGFSGFNSVEVTRVFNTAVNQDIRKKKKCKLPVAMYDKKIKRAYLENPDGTRDYV